MEVSDRARLGPSTVDVTRLGLGCAPLGNLFRSVSDSDALDTVEAAWNCGVRYFDVAPQYGLGLAERRLGRALAGYRRDDYVISTKVGRVLVDDENAETGIFNVERGTRADFDFSRDGVLRSLDASLDRLGLDRVDVVLVHDPDNHESDAMQGAFPTLFELRDQGVIRAVGCGMNQAAMLERFVDRLNLDCVLVAGRWTLLDRSASSLLDTCERHNVGVIVAGVFNSGVLAQPVASPTFDYAPASADVRERALLAEKVCEQHGTSLLAAATQFGSRHPAVATTIVGARTAVELREDVAGFTSRISPSLWAAFV